MMKLKDFILEKINSIRDKSGNKQIMQLTYFFVAVFIFLIVYIIVFLFKDSREVINNPYNPREEIFAKKVVRGSILSNDGTPLAYTDISNGTETRVYPYAEAFSHVVGYNTKGKQGIELYENFTLLTSNQLIYERLINDADGKKNKGDNIVTSLDVDAQLAAYNALGNNRGAVVLMNSKTGEILALVSKPDFNPNTIGNDWNMINSGLEACLLNRATNGLYPPGSTFKIVTALEYINEYSSTDDYSFDCTGTFSYDGSTINCYHGISHGEVDFDTSFAKSCNSSYANITTKLSKSGFEKTCKDLLFNSDIPCPIRCKKSYVPISRTSSTDELIQTGIGQGKTEITPYHMCLISAAISNNGILMTPTIVKRVENANGDLVKKTTFMPYRQLLSRDEASRLTGLMREVVVNGTASRIKDTDGYKVYGKTGSAEYSSDKSQSHAWFTGFAKTDSDDKIAISVIVEGGGSGGETAVPIAKKVFDAYFK